MKSIKLPDPNEIAIPEEDLPLKTKTQDWIDFFKSIPLGQCIKLTEQNIPIKPLSILPKVRYYKKKGYLPKNYYCVIQDKRKTVYVCNGKDK